MTVKKRMILCLLLLWSVMILGIGGSYAKYQSTKEQDFVLKIRKPGTFSVTGRDGEAMESWQVQSDNSVRLGFAVSNQDTVQGSAHNSDLLYTLTITSTGEAGNLSLGTFDAAGNEIIYEGHRIAWEEDSKQYQEVGPGYYWKFYDQNGKELIWELEGGKVSFQNYFMMIKDSMEPELIEIIVEETAYSNQISQQTVFEGLELLPKSNCLSENGNIVILNDWSLEKDAGTTSEFKVTLFHEDGILTGNIEWSSEQDKYFEVEILEQESENLEEKTYIVTIVPNESKLKEVDEPLNAKIILQWIPEKEEYQDQILWAEIRIILEPEVKDVSDTPPENTEDDENKSTENEKVDDGGTTVPGGTEDTENTIPKDSKNSENVVPDETVNGEGIDLELPEETILENVLQPIYVSTSGSEEGKTGEFKVHVLQNEISKKIPAFMCFELLDSVTALEIETVENFPAYTKYSVDGGKRYYILAQGGKIVLESEKIKEKVLQIDFSDAVTLWETDASELDVNVSAYEEETVVETDSIKLFLQETEGELFTWKSGQSIPIVGLDSVLQYTVGKMESANDSIMLDFYIEQRKESGYQKLGSDIGPVLETNTSEENLILTISSRDGNASAGCYRLIVEGTCQGEVIKRTAIPFFVNYRESTQEASQ